MLLTLEPPRLPVNADPRLDEDRDGLQKAPRLLSVADDGTPTFATENEELTLQKRIARIDVERGGLLSVHHDTLEEDKMLDVQTGANGKPTAEDLMKAKEQIYWRLERNRQSVLSGWSLLNQLLPPQKAVGVEDVPNLQFPQDAFATTLLDLPLVSRTAQERLFDASITLARRQNDLKMAAERLQSASSALQASVEQSSKNWATWLDWADRGRVQAVAVEPHANLRDALGISRAAKNLLAYFGIDEAAERIRGSSYAGLDDDGRIALHPRRKGRRRLKLKIRLAADAQEFDFCPSQSDERYILDSARQEVLDEELFSLVSDEGEVLRTTAKDDIISIFLPGGGLLALSMVPLEELPKVEVSAPLALLVLSFLRLRLVAVYRSRKKVIHPSKVPLPAAVTSSAPLILEPTLSLLTLYLRTARVLSLMRCVAALLPQDDARVDVITPDVDLQQMGPANGATISLRLPGDSSVHARVSADAPTVFVDLTDGRRIVPATEAMLKPILDFEVRRAYAIELGRRLGKVWQVEKERGRCIEGKSKKILQVSFDSETGLSCTVDNMRHPRDAPGKTLYEWAAAA